MFCPLQDDSGAPVVSAPGKMVNIQSIHLIRGKFLAAGQVLFSHLTGPVRHNRKSWGQVSTKAPQTNSSVRVAGRARAAGCYSNFVSEDVMQLFRETGAYLKGHFRLTSGLHSNEFLQCALVLRYPNIAGRFGADLAARLPDCDIVVSPAIGGLIIGHEVARAKSATVQYDARAKSAKIHDAGFRGVPFLFTERDSDGRMALRRGFSVQPGETAIVIEDVVTTGGSTREVIALLTAAGARVVGAGSVIDRSGGRADVGVPRVALATLDAITYPPEDCPLCKQGLPVVKPGSRPGA
jgi:orotate phosphoribosyltransferase